MKESEMFALKALQQKIRDLYLRASKGENVAFALVHLDMFIEREFLAEPLRVYLVFEKADDPYAGGPWLLKIFKSYDLALKWVGNNKDFFIDEVEVE